MNKHREPAVGQHALDGKPIELAQGWIVRCTCGWNNEVKPAESRDAALTQLAVHQR
jgi:hypothetical protein